MSPLLLWALLQATPAGEPLLATTGVRPASGHEVRRAWLDDLDGDGRLDLLLASCEAERESARRLAVHLRRAAGVPCFEPRPDHVLELTPDVVAVAVGDVHPDEGRELVLLSARGAYAWRPRAGEAERVVRLAGGLELLWQVAEPGAPLVWRAGARDLDGDGRDELLLPEPEGFRLLWGAGAGEDARTQLLRFPDGGPALGPDRRGGSSGARRSGREMEIALRLPATEARWRGPLLSLEDELPAPRLADWDGDGDLDLLAQDDERLHVWRQADGALEELPGTSAALPVAPRRERGFDLAFEARDVDLDRDGRADLVLLVTDRHSEDLRTQVLVFLQAAARGAPLFGDEGVPAQLLVLGGLASGTRLVDVDGDGALDLACIAFRVDQIDRLVSVAGDAVDGQLTVFLGRGGRFAARPDVVERVALGDDPDRDEVRFLPDVNGDGVLELLERPAAERLALRLSRRTRAGPSWSAEAAWTLEVGEDARVLAQEPLPGAATSPPAGAQALELLVVEPHEVRHVRSR